MHDTAKRGVVFAVAAGGLLLAGAAQASAETVTDAAQPGAATATQLESGAGRLPNAVQARENARAAEQRSQGSTSPAFLKARDAAEPAYSAGILSGNRIDLPVALSLNLCGNGVTLFGHTSAASTCGTLTPATQVAAESATRRGGLLADNVVRAPLTVPVNVCGNHVAVAATADSGSGSTCVADASGTSAAQPSMESAVSGNEPAVVVARLLGGMLSANEVRAPITAPANVCGNTVGAASTSSAAVTCLSGQSAVSSPAAAAASAGVGKNQPQQSSSTALALPAAAANCLLPGGAGSALDLALKSPQQAAAPAAMTQPVQVAPASATVAKPAAPVPALQPAAPSSAAPVGGAAHPNAVSGQKPLTAHPMVVWPRPESVSFRNAAANESAISDPVQQASQVLADPPALAQTGAHMAVPAGAAALTMTGGLGLRALSRQSRGGRHSVTG